MIPAFSPSMTFMMSIKTCLSKYCTFSGRARRSEFWYFFLVCVIISSFFLSILYVLVPDLYFGYYSNYSYNNRNYKVINISTFGYVWIVIFLVIELVLSIPLLAASVRRLHDIGKTGCWLFIELIPFGIFFLLYLWSLDSQIETNIYGESPKYNMPLNSPIINNGGLGFVQPGLYPVANPVMAPAYGQGNVNVQPNLYQPLSQPGQPINNPSLGPQIQQNITAINPPHSEEQKNDIPIPVSDNLFDKPGSEYNSHPPNGPNN